MVVPTVLVYNALLYQVLKNIGRRLYQKNQRHMEVVSCSEYYRKAERTFSSYSVSSAIAMQSTVLPGPRRQGTIVVTDEV